MTSTSEVLSALSALSAGHYYLMRIVVLLSRSHRLCHERVFLSHRKNGKNGNLCSALRSLSVISVISVGQYYLMRIVFYCPDFYCPAEIKEIAEIIVTRPRDVLSALSAGLENQYPLSTRWMASSRMSSTLKLTRMPTRRPSRRR